MSRSAVEARGTSEAIGVMNAPFIQQTTLTISRKLARPDDGVEAALRAEHVEKEEQRREKQKTHELLHAIPSTGRAWAEIAARRVAR